MTPQALINNLQTMLAELNAKLPDTYTHIEAKCSKTSASAEPVVVFRCYQSITGWTEEHSTWDGALAQATAPAFAAKCLRAAAAAKQQEASQLLERAAKIEQPAPEV